MSCSNKKRIVNVAIQPGCITCGLCEFIAPEVFQVTDVSHVKSDVAYTSYTVGIKQAANECPVQVITYKEEEYE